MTSLTKLEQRVLAIALSLTAYSGEKAEDIADSIMALIKEENEACARDMETYYGFSDDEKRIAASVIRNRMKDQAP